MANLSEKAYARFPALQYGDFRTLWFGLFFASATMMFQFYAPGWFITPLTISERAICRARRATSQGRRNA